MVYKEQPGGSSEEETTLPVSPTQSSDHSGQDDTHTEQAHEVVLVLPSNNLVTGQVRDVGYSDLSSGLDNHPSYVRPPETLVC